MAEQLSKDVEAGLNEAVAWLRKERENLQQRMAQVESALQGIEQLAGPPKQRGPRWTPEQRARLSQAQKQSWARRKKAAQTTK